LVADKILATCNDDILCYQCIRREISVVADKIRSDAEAAKIESEWKFAAMVRYVPGSLDKKGEDAPFFIKQRWNIQ
jgi:hypothetical protein